MPQLQMSQQDLAALYASIRDRSLSYEDFKADYPGVNLSLRDFGYMRTGRASVAVLQNKFTTGGYQITNTPTSDDDDVPGGDGVDAPPGNVDTIDTGDETIITGLPLFNQSMRNMLSQLFTGALGSASRDVAAGARGNEVLNLNPEDMFKWLAPALDKLDIPQTPANPPADPTPIPEPQPPIPPAPDADTDSIPDDADVDDDGDGVVDPPAPDPVLNTPFEVLLPPHGGTPTADAVIPEPTPIPPPPTADAPSSLPVVPPSDPNDETGWLDQDVVIELLKTVLNARPDESGDPLVPQADPTPIPEPTPIPVPGPALGGPVPPGGGEDDGMIAPLFKALLGGGGRAGTGISASPGLGEIAMLMSIMGGAKNMFGGQPDPGPQVAQGNTPPFEPAFQTPNSLASFMQLLQLFGPGSGNSLGASPGIGDITNPANISTGPEMANNPLTNIVQSFSLPSYTGPFSAPSTALQQQSTDYASEFLKSNPMSDPGFMRSLQEMYTTGGRFDNTDQYKALEGITNRRMEEGNASLNEMFGGNGLRFGSDVAKGQAGLSSELLAQESLQRAQIAQSSFENASNRRMQALGLAPQAATSQINNAATSYNMGEQNRQIQDQGIQRQMAEFARTQGGLFPLLLQFALAGTEGDTVVLE